MRREGGRVVVVEAKVAESGRELCGLQRPCGSRGLDRRRHNKRLPSHRSLVSESAFFPFLLHLLLKTASADSPASSVPSHLRRSVYPLLSQILRAEPGCTYTACALIFITSYPLVSPSCIQPTSVARANKLFLLAI